MQTQADKKTHTDVTSIQVSIEGLNALEVMDPDCSIATEKSCRCDGTLEEIKH